MAEGKGLAVEDCLSCSLIGGARDLPGGTIHATSHWVVQHCVGSLGVGTLIVAPSRHCVHVWELTDEETAELGPLLRQVAAAIHALLACDQVYVCVWSHTGWRPVHLHYVLQPSWNHLQEQYPRPGPHLQADMLRAEVLPPREEVEAFAARARGYFRSGVANATPPAPSAPPP